MLRCSPEAFAQCPTRALCGSVREATFTEDSECAKFNRSITDRPLTNADCIRAMSDEQLANLLTDYSNNGGWATEAGREVCFERIIEWLRQPAEEDDNG